VHLPRIASHRNTLAPFRRRQHHCWCPYVT
jgi:hypothetical protein